MTRGNARLCALAAVALAASSWYALGSIQKGETPPFDCPAGLVAFEDRGGVRVDCSAPPGSKVVRLPLGAARAMGQPVDLNAVGQEELESLPGIGPAIARRIIAERRSRGPFKDVDDLIRVRGIGPSKLAAIRDALTLPRR